MKNPQLLSCLTVNKTRMPIFATSIQQLLEKNKVIEIGKYIIDDILHIENAKESTHTKKMITAHK